MKTQKNIIIVGGGTSGWITALFLAKKLPSNLFNITLVSSKEIGTIGVGESTLPHIVNFLLDLGINENEMMKFCNGTYKVGIKFTNWSKKNDSFNHPFTGGLTSNYYNKLPFSHYWFHYFSDMNYDKLSDISYHVFNSGKSPKSDNCKSYLDYAYHLDSSLLGVFLKEKSLSLGVKHLEGKVDDFSFKNNGYIDKISVGYKQLKGDLFFDCSGFRSILLSGFKENNFNSYSNELFCDNAFFCRTKRQESFVAPYTESIAMKYGWRWNIPLYDKNGNGYAYSSKYVSKDDAESEFRESLGLSSKDKINHLSMKLGRYDFSWFNNCIGVGSSYGFIEPLEATGIYLFCKQLEDFISSFEKSNYIIDIESVNNYNKNIGSTLDSIKDFIVLHYFASNRSDTDFWKDYSKYNKFSSSFHNIIHTLSLGFPNESINSNLNSLFKYESYSRILIGLGFYDDIFNKINTNDSNILIIKRDIYNLLVKNKKLLKTLKSHRNILNDINS